MKWDTRVSRSIAVRTAAAAHQHRCERQGAETDANAAGRILHGLLALLALNRLSLLFLGVQLVTVLLLCIKECCWKQTETKGVPQKRAGAVGSDRRDWDRIACIAAAVVVVAECSALMAVGMVVAVVALALLCGFRFKWNTYMICVLCAWVKIPSSSQRESYSTCILHINFKWRLLLSFAIDTLPYTKAWPHRKPPFLRTKYKKDGGTNR